MRIDTPQRYEKHRLNIPPWPTDPEEKAALRATALEIEEGWRNARAERHARRMELEREQTLTGGLGREGNDGLFL